MQSSVVVRDGRVRTKVLYIGGYSRSGSTILEMGLNIHPDVTSTGELTFLLDDALDGRRRCTCGAPYHTCERYGPAVRQVTEEDARLLRRIESREGLRDLRAGRIPAEDRRAYATLTRRIFDRVAAHSGARLIVDSSKSAGAAAGRALALSEIAGLDVHFLHLSRSPQATLSSYLRNGSNWVAEGHRKPRILEAYRPIVGWTLANRAAMSMRRAFGPDRYLHVRYEDIVADPVRHMRRVGEFVDLDLERVGRAFVNGVTFTAEHNVGGNRARLAPQKMRFRTDDSRIPGPLAALLQVVGGPVIRDLGYRR